MNFATSLIMTAIFFRLFGIRLNGVDLLPDCIGILLIMFAVSILSRKEYEFKNVYMPSTFALVLSMWGLYNFMPAEPNIGFGILYAVMELAFLVAETVTYKTLFDGYGSMYREVCTKGFLSLKIYAVTRAAGIAMNLAVWTIAGNEDYFAVIIGYYVWALIDIIVSTYLVYNFYVLKPKFR